MNPQLTLQYLVAILNIGVTEGGVGASYAGPSQFPHFSFQVWISFAQFEASTGTDESMEQARFVDEKNCNSS